MLTRDALNHFNNRDAFPLIHAVAPKTPCAAIAVAIISGADEKDVVKLFDDFQPDWRRIGTYSNTAKNAFDKLGFTYEKVSIVNKNSIQKKNHFSISEVEFMLRNPKGKFYIRVRGHAYVIWDGNVLDCGYHRNTRLIFEAYRIKVKNV